MELKNYFITESKWFDFLSSLSDKDQLKLEELKITNTSIFQNTGQIILIHDWNNIGYPNKIILLFFNKNKLTNFRPMNKDHFITYITSIENITDSTDH
jgi:hypothetical protein